MLTGKRLFEGATASDAMAAVLRAEPPWATLPSDTPPLIQRLLRRCLEKDPQAASRFRVGRPLEEIEETLGPSRVRHLPIYGLRRAAPPWFSAAVMGTLGHGRLSMYRPPWRWPPAPPPVNAIPVGGPAVDTSRAGPCWTRRKQRHQHRRSYDGGV